MCGIFGIFGTRADNAPARAAMEAMAHRGPDGAEFARVAEDGLFGHTRLAIIDLDARANQPMTGLGGRLSIVFNGEIYNAPELRAQMPDYPWMTDHSDTEAILAAYAKWGVDCVRHLRGMFAFGLWDSDQKLLMLAVDRFSIKPLLVAEDGKILRFASTARAIGCLGFRLVPHMPAVRSWLADGQLETGTATFFEGVRQVPAANYGIWRDGAFSLHRYWSPPETGTERVEIDEIEAALDDALQCHMLSDVPVGINLSSGIDSAVLRALSEARGKPLHAFTFSFPGTIYDEAERARPVADGTEWSTTPIEPEAMWRDLGPATLSTEAPLGGVGIYGHWRNAQTAREAGYKVLLAGEGADEVFAGYKYYAEEAICCLWHAGRREEAEEMYASFAGCDHEEWQGSAAVLAQRNSGGGSKGVRAPDGTSLRSHFLTEAFSAGPRLDEPPKREGDPVRAAMWADLAHLKIPKLLRWQDRCYMASGVEIRVPYLDHVLVERMARLGSEQMFDKGLTKAPLRQLGELLLPREFLSQPKLYVATPQREWLKDDLRGHVEDLLDPGAALVEAGIVDLETLRSDYRAYIHDVALGNSFFIWKYIAMEYLFQSFFRPSGDAVRLVA